VTEALIDNVAASAQKLVVTVSSGLGSLGSLAQQSGTGSGLGYAYRTSKAAVNMAMLALAREVQPRGITVVILNPGWVRTDMGGPNAKLSPEESIAGMRRVIADLTPADAGRFLSHDGTELPW
jgi:NAD(P)-dependent dehydrogenase (short-subunit alcohol dehydrogenase family)